MLVHPALPLRELVAFQHREPLDELLGYLELRLGAELREGVLDILSGAGVHRKRAKPGLAADQFNQLVGALAAADAVRGQFTGDDDVGHVVVDVALYPFQGVLDAHGAHVAQPELHQVLRGVEQGVAHTLGVRVQGQHGQVVLHSCCSLFKSRLLMFLSPLMRNRFFFVLAFRSSSCINMSHLVTSGLLPPSNSSGMGMSPIDMSNKIWYPKRALGLRVFPASKRDRLP